MTNDTTPQSAATPSAPEILALAYELGIKTRTGAGAIKLIRAVLDRWGAPQAAGQQSEPVREPLTDEQLGACIGSAGFKTWDSRMWALKREIEATHGITSKTKGAQP